ncbi:hypothetical protein GGI11_008004, partial [Coemansia sp. RSA 2049]
MFDDPKLWKKQPKWIAGHLEAEDAVEVAVRHDERKRKHKRDKGALVLVLDPGHVSDKRNHAQGADG